jgi:predicted metal-dependent peptidase
MLPGTSVSFSFSPFVSFNQQPKLAQRAVAVADAEIDWGMALENDLATESREMTSRHRVDRRSLLPLVAQHDA